MANKTNQITFPDELAKALYAIAQKYNLKLIKDTHYDAINRVLYWYENKMLKRINFECLSHQVDVCLYQDEFPIAPRLFSWLHNNIPMFPYLAKISWQQLDNLPLDQSYEYYLEKINSFLMVGNLNV